MSHRQFRDPERLDRLARERDMAARLIASMVANAPAAFVGGNNANILADYCTAQREFRAELLKSKAGAA